MRQKQSTVQLDALAIHPTNISYRHKILKSENSLVTCFYSDVLQGWSDYGGASEDNLKSGRER
jgi:hypothetical protein